MKFIHEIFSTIDWKMTTPPSYGVFHFLSVLLMIVIIIIIARYLKINKEKTVRITLITCTAFMLTLCSSALYFNSSSQIISADYAHYFNTSRYIN